MPIPYTDFTEWTKPPTVFKVDKTPNCNCQ